MPTLTSEIPPRPGCVATDFTDADGLGRMGLISQRSIYSRSTTLHLQHRLSEHGRKTQYQVLPIDLVPSLDTVPRCESMNVPTPLASNAASTSLFLSSFMCGGPSAPPCRDRQAPEVWWIPRAQKEDRRDCPAVLRDLAVLADIDWPVGLCVWGLWRGALRLCKVSAG